MFVIQKLESVGKKIIGRVVVYKLKTTYYRDLYLILNRGLCYVTYP